MKVRDLIEQEIDIDVYDDVCDGIGIAFCGPLKLTEQGKEKFAEVLDYNVKLTNYNGDTVAIICIDDPADFVWEARLEKATEFFEAAAGYCADSDYHKWFVCIDG